MKRFIAIIVMLFSLCGCESNDTGLERGLCFREKMLSAPCSFTAEIYADYGDISYLFCIGCSADSNGAVSFVVQAPESISGIAGKITGETGSLTFDNEVLAFPLLAEGEITPVSAPWILVNTLRSGYLSSTGMVGDTLQLTLYDSYAEEALMLDVWLNGLDVPVRADILWQGRRILSIAVKNFVFV